MSLATDFLTDYLGRTQMTASEFSRASGIPASNLSEIFKGDVEISGRNLGKFLRGIREEHERDGFLAAYLRGSIPEDQATRVLVHVKQDKRAAVAEGSEASLEADLAAAFDQLPNDTYRRRVVRFLAQLRRDEELRELFRRTMDYVDDGNMQKRDDSASTGAAIYNAHKDSPTAGLPGGEGKKKKA